MPTKPKSEVTSARLATIAGRVLKNPKSATIPHILELAACVLTQVENKKAVTNKRRNKKIGDTKMAKGTKKSGTKKGGTKKGGKMC